MLFIEFDPFRFTLIPITFALLYLFGQVVIVRFIFISMPKLVVFLPCSVIGRSHLVVGVASEGVRKGLHSGKISPPTMENSSLCWRTFLGQEYAVNEYSSSSVRMPDSVSGKPKRHHCLAAILAFYSGIPFSCWITVTNNPP